MMTRKWEELGQADVRVAEARLFPQRVAPDTTNRIGETTFVRLEEKNKPNGEEAAAGKPLVCRASSRRSAL